MNSDNKKFDPYKNIPNLVKDITVFLWDAKTHNDFTKYSIQDLQKVIDMKNFSPLKKFLKIQDIDIYNTSYSVNKILIHFRNSLATIIDQEDYKKWYTQQLVVGMARMEWVQVSTITKIYWGSVSIDEEMQKVFKENNLTLMDLSSKDVILWEKEKELFIYTMLFLHTGEKKWELRHKSAYYNIKEWWVEITEYWIKSFEQAFNCAWQIYNELFYHGVGLPSSFLPHHTINTIDDIYNLYDSNTVITYSNDKIDAHQLSWILNITRALLHIQAHKQLDYVRWVIHDPASFIRYKKGKTYKEIYWSQIDEVRDWEVKALWDEELSKLDIKDSKWQKIQSRTPSTYDPDNKSWSIKDCVFNDTQTTFSWRSKWLVSWIMKLVNDPRFKKGKSVTDSLWNSFYVKNKEDWLKIWLGLIEQLPEHIVDDARIEIKWEVSWKILLDKISKDWNLFDVPQIKENLKPYGIWWERVSLLLRNKNFNILLQQQLNIFSKEVYNEKTRYWYEEFKLVTTTGTEYQISEKKNDDIISLNERWFWNHGIYDFKKLMEFILRPNNHSMVLWHDIIKNMIKWALDKEESYLINRAKTAWIITTKNKKDFNPWSAILHQLLYEEDNFIDHSDEIADQIIKNQENYFNWNSTWEASSLHINNEGKTIPSKFITMKEWWRNTIEEYLYNLIQKNYIGYVNSDNEYIVSKKWWNERLLKTQLEWYNLFIKKLPKES